MTSTLERSTDAAKRVFLSRPRKDRRETGAFLTPPRVAIFMAEQVDLSRHPEGGTLRILDPGCGTGMLAAALVDRVQEERPDLSVEVTLNDIEEAFLGEAEKAIAPAARVRRAAGSFAAWAAEHPNDHFDVIVANPPYKKVSCRADGGALRNQIEQFTVGANNLYTAFLGIATTMLNPTTGQLVFITPRSYLSGQYFSKFRGELSQRVTPRQIHLFQSRTGVFTDADAVLQETIILRADIGHASAGDPVLVTHSDGSQGLKDVAALTTTAGVLWAGSPSGPWSLPTCQSDLDLLAEVRQLPHTMQKHGLSVSTGPVVPFRSRNRVHDEQGETSAGRIPLLWLQHVTAGQVGHPIAGFRKEQWYEPAGTDDTAVSRGDAVLVLRRFSPKEDERRVVGAVVEPSDLCTDGVAIENHLNVIGGGTPAVLRGVLAYLTSERTDRFLRLSSGNTQISATELRALPLPSKDELAALGMGSVRTGDAS